MKTLSRTRVKICGITRLEDALSAVAQGADALGFVFYAKSPRAVTPEQAAAILAQLPPFVSSVGLFVNAPPQEIDATLERAPLDLLQFHGEESARDCAAFSRPYIKAIRMAPEVNLAEQARRYSQARALLLDTYVAGVQGGTGQRFDWSRIPENFAKPLVIAGGLDAENVAEVIQQARPYAVDVSGGVEAAKGIKDPAKISAFMRAVREQ